MSNPYHVEVNQEEGFIRIARHSREMLYWDQGEWEGDSEVYFTIMTAVVMALSDPEAMDGKLRTMGKL
jgi:hypothetical protein